jgi:hypothetical protein
MSNNQAARIHQLEDMLRTCATRLEDSVDIVLSEVPGADEEDIRAAKEFIAEVRGVAAGGRPQLIRSTLGQPRFEDQIHIVIECCRQPMVLGGNLSLREAGAPVTQLAYECEKCFRRVSVVDAWTPPPSAAMLAAYDDEP